MRRPLTVLCALALASGLIAATPAAEDGTGEVRTSLQPLALQLSHVPIVGDVGGSLGALTALASTLDGADAQLLLEGLRAGDVTTADWQVSGQDGPSSGSDELPLDGPLTTGGLTLADYLAQADGDTAVARLGALTGELGLAPLGLVAELGGSVTTQVVPGSSSGLTELGVEGLGLSVGDLLPQQLLDALPLGLLLDLLSELPLDLDADLDALLGQLDGLLDTLRGIVALDVDRLDALHDLLDLLGDDPAVADALAQLEAAVDAVADLQAAVADAAAALTGPLADLADAEALVTTLQAELATIESTISSLEATVASLTAELGSLQGDRTSLGGLSLGGLEALLTGYPDAGCPTPTLLPVPNLTQVASCLEAHLTGLITDAQVELATATTQLTAAEGERTTLLPQLADATAAVTAGQAVVGPLQDALDAVEALLADAVATVTDAAEGLLAAIEAAATSGDALALLDLLTDLTDQLRDLLDDLLGSLTDLPDLLDLRDLLAGELAGAALFDIGRLAVEVEVQAGPAGSESTVRCEVSDLRVLGQTPLPALDCQQLDAALGEVESVLSGLLGALPIDLPVAVEIGGLQISTDTAADPVEGVWEALASVSALRVGVGSVELLDLVDGLTDELGTLLDQVLSIADGLDGLDVGELPLLDLVLQDLLDADLLSLLGSASLPAQAQAASLTPLDELAAVVDQLPVGDLLDGLRTVGLDLSVLSVETLGQHVVPAQTPGEPVEPGEPAVPGQPQQPGAGAPTPPGSDGPTLGAPTGDPSQRLPRTGSTALTMLALALVLTTGGLHLRRVGS